MGDFQVQDGQLFLFQGDSITDAGRRAEAAPFGIGYASLFVEMITAQYPERSIRYINKGIGGDNTAGLRVRWEDDVIGHQPDWLSIMIGINDLHTFLRQDGACVTVDLYRENYDFILAQTRDKTDARLILVDPFYISNDAGGESFESTVLETIEAYIGVVHDMVAKYETYHVRTHEVFQRHLAYRESGVFCPEPVHPARAGHVVIAQALIDALHGG